MPYKSMKDVNKSIRGIKPAVTLEQANIIAKWADSIENKAIAWPVAISQFKKLYKIDGEGWSKRTKKDEDERERAMSGIDRALREIALGGPGSGNWAHVGRPGKRGGSAPRSGGMSIAKGRDWKQRQAAAKGGGAAKITGNGLYGNDGTASEKQVDYIRSLIQDEPEWGELYGLRPSDDSRIRLYKEARNSDIVMRPLKLPTGEFTQDFKISVAKKMYNAALDWARGLDVSSMSKSGASKFISTIKSSTLLQNMIEAHSNIPNHLDIYKYPSEKVNFINRSIGEEVLRVDKAGTVIPVNINDFDDYELYLEDL